MNSVVIDANVIIKWIFPERPGEDHQSEAIYLLREIKNGNIQVYQPPHWIAEVTAVVARLKPEIANEIVNLLFALEFPIIEEPEIYYLAAQLSDKFHHHLFDTLYHATALHQGYSFITADQKYFHKTHKLGSIIHLKDFFNQS